MEGKKDSNYCYQCYFLAIGIAVAILEKNPAYGIVMWITGAWITETLVAEFSKSGDKISSLARNMGVSLFSGIFASTSGGSTLWVFIFTIALFKAIFGLIVISAILVFEFFAFPITSIYYFIKSR